MKKPLFLTEEEIDFYNREGYLIKKGGYTKNEIDELKKVYNRIWFKMVATRRADENATLDSLFRHLFQMHRVNNDILKFLTDSRNFRIAEDLLGEEVLATATTMYYKAPGMRGSDTHRDRYGYGDGIYGGKSCALWISLDHADKQNGTVFVIPKTQKLGLLNISIHIGHTKPVPDGFEIVTIDTEPGDILMWDSLTVHGSTPNVSEDRLRRAFFIYFTGTSVEKISFGHTDLINKDGQHVSKPYSRTFNTLKNKLVNAPYWGEVHNEAPDSFRSKYVNYLDEQ